jgi:hypothetical protein
MHDDQHQHSTSSDDVVEVLYLTVQLHPTGWNGCGGSGSHPKRP